MPKYKPAAILSTYQEDAATAVLADLARLSRHTR